MLILQRCRMLHFKDQLHRNQLSDCRTATHRQLMEQTIFGEIQVIPVSHGQKINALVKQPGKSRCSLVLRKLVNDKQIHPQVIQLALVIPHLRGILMPAAVLVDNPGCKVEECFSSLELLRH